jgi:ankyrin repeat protein
VKKGADIRLQNKALHTAEQVASSALSQDSKYLLQVRTLEREQAERNRIEREHFERMETAVKNSDLITLKTFTLNELRNYSDVINRKSLLSIAAVSNQVESINYLIDTVGIPVNSCNLHNDTALHYAAHHGANEAIQALVKKGADIRLQNKALRTAEQVASSALSQDSKYLLHVRTLESVYKLFNVKKKTEVPKPKSNDNNHSFLSALNCTRI